MPRAGEGAYIPLHGSSRISAAQGFRREERASRNVHIPVFSFSDEHTFLTVLYSRQGTGATRAGTEAPNGTCPQAIRGNRDWSHLKLSGGHAPPSSGTPRVRSSQSEQDFAVSEAGVCLWLNSIYSVCREVRRAGACVCLRDLRSPCSNLRSVS